MLDGQNISQKKVIRCNNRADLPQSADTLYFIVYQIRARQK